MRSTSSTTSTPKVQPRALSSIRLRRVALGLRIWEVARALGRDSTTLSRLERGERQDPDLEQRVAAFLAGLERAQKKDGRA